MNRAAAKDTPVAVPADFAVAAAAVPVVVADNVTAAVDAQLAAAAEAGTLLGSSSS